MDKLLFFILCCIFNVCLFAQSDSQTVEVKTITLSNCLDKTIDQRNETFSYHENGSNLFDISHKDILVNSSNSTIDVEVSWSNDSIFIRETEITDENGIDNKCLKDLSYQIQVDLDVINIFLVVTSEVSSQPNQIYYVYGYSNSYLDYCYPITEKTSYQYQSFIMDGNCEWITSAHWGMDGYKTIISDVDTLILGKTYKKIYGNFCSQPDVKKYEGAIREEDQRVYFVGKPYNESSETKEELIYDFNLMVGDQIEYDEYICGNRKKLEVLHIDTLKIEGILRRKFYFNDITSEYGYVYPAEDACTEGIGGEYVFTRPFQNLPTGDISMLLGVRHNGKSLYCDGYRCTCESILPISEYKSIPAYRILDNPIKGRKLIVSFSEADFIRMDIYAFNGLLVLTKDVIVRNGIMEIPLENLHAGNYIMVLSRSDNSRESVQFIVV